MSKIVQFPVTQHRHEDDEETAVDLQLLMSRIESHQASAHQQLSDAVETLVDAGRHLLSARKLTGKLRSLDLW